CDNPTVEGFDVEVEIVFQFGDVDLAGLGVDHAYLFATLEVDSTGVEQGFVADRRFVVDQPVVGHRLAVAVGIDRLPEDVGGVLGRGGGQADTVRIEIIQRSEEHTSELQSRENLV